MSDPHFFATRTRDAEEHAAALSAWDQRYEQITPGRFDGRLEDLRIGPVQVFREHTTQAVLQSGRPRDGTVTVALTDAAAGTGWFCGHRLEGVGTIAIASGGEFEFVTAPGMELLAVCIDTDELTRHADRVRGSGFALDVPRACRLDGLPPRHAELRELLDAAMQLGREHAALLAQPALRRTLALSMSDLVLDCIAPDHRRAQLPTSAAARQRIVRAARAYMQAHADAVITVPELCEAACASRRALQYAFEDVLNLSPITYLRTMRLNRVRRDLLAEPQAGVGDIAARWGFWHLSRFAADYRAMFGELPSATRARGRVPMPDGADPTTRIDGRERDQAGPAAAPGADAAPPRAIASQSIA